MSIYTFGGQSCHLQGLSMFIWRYLRDVAGDLLVGASQGTLAEEEASLCTWQVPRLKREDDDQESLVS